MKEEMTVQVHDLRSPRQRLQATTRRTSWDRHTNHYKNKPARRKRRNTVVLDLIGLSIAIVFLYVLAPFMAAGSAAYGG